jgi:hypothetical protein
VIGNQLRDSRLQVIGEHTTGNQTLVLNISTGIWASSENAIAAECLVPEHSALVGRWTNPWTRPTFVHGRIIHRGGNS